jgi:cytochrome c-type biogenesis protein CcmH/NrfG
MSGSAFAGRHFGATNLSVGRLNSTAATALASTSIHRFPAGSTFAARHGLTASAGLTTASFKPANTPSLSMGGNGGSNGMNSNSSYPYNLNLGFGRMIPTRIFLGYPSWFAYPWYSNYGYGYGGGCFSYCGYYGLPTPAAFVPTSTAAAVPTTAAGTIDYAALGETEFRAGNYVAAENHWRHALVDDTSNTAIVMLLGQALFANGKYDEAAGAIQHALRLLPAEKWGVVVGHYTELYRSNQDYTDQLRALEAASEKPETDSPGVRFLLGYHYGYLGYPKHAVRELDKTLAQVPQDDTAQKLRTIMAARVPADDPSAKPTSRP